jgi:hypothetical protein
VHLPVGPCVVDCREAFPFAPAEGHVSACQGVLASRRHHRFVGDWDAGVGGKDLTFLLFACVDGQGETGVNARVKFRQVVIQIGLADLGICCQDVLDKRAEVDAIETFGWVVEDGVVDIVNGSSKLVARDGKDKFVGGPSLACDKIGGP